MSHFTVAVICEDPDYLDDILAPYREYDGSEDFPEELLEFEDHSEEVYSDYAKYSKECGLYGERKSIEDFGKEQGFSIKDRYSINDEEEQIEFGYFNNPNSKWDWWVVGGRWAGQLKTKDGDFVSYAQIKDLIFETDQKEYDEAIRFWEVVVEGKPLAEGEEEPFSMWKPEYYINQYSTKENYARAQSTFSTWALIDTDGKWYEKGEMGWFGMSDATQESRVSYEETFNRILQSADPEYYLIMVDCHI